MTTMTTDSTMTTMTTDTTDSTATMALAVLNTSIVTVDGTYNLEEVTLEEAQALVSAAPAIDSAVGHASTAAILTEILGVEIPMNRQMFEQKPGQKALVLKMNGRLPEGVILSLTQIEEVGFTLKVLTRLS